VGGRNRQRFLSKFDMKPGSGYKYFFTKSRHHHTYQNYGQPPQTSQNSDFQSCFSVSKIDQIFFL
jgi:hypothetical protein